MKNLFLVIFSLTIFAISGVALTADLPNIEYRVLATSKTS